MGNWIKTVGQIFHHRGDTAPAPAGCENEISQQKAERVTYIQSDGSNASSIRDPGSAGKSPGTETGHETAQTGHQPGNSAPTAKVFCRAAVKAHYVKTDNDHQQAVDRYNRIINLIGAAHDSAFLYCLFRPIGSQ